ncbi:MAG: hypothetical protein CMK46_06600 [Porticoccus sp.]|nr:hypothetical protein [Porticoccus sp.]|tara:strand:+ start:5150 stop:5650 length:501 start_codon:yes stop_codon:yes gene_type:complete
MSNNLTALAKQEIFFDELDAESYRRITGAKMSMVQDQTLLNVAGVAPSGKELGDPADWAVQQLADFAPHDAVESMLVQQMIALNRMAMDCSKRALIDGQIPQCRDMNMKHAAKLMATFSKLSMALDKHRGKGQQTIVVKHQQVNVGNGGQAVIGEVKHGGLNGKDK